MTTHVHGPDSYVEADYYTVVFERPFSDWDDKWRPETECYCGDDAEYLSRVGFHVDTTEETTGNCPTSRSRTVKAHRCEKHRLRESDTNY